MSQIIFKKIRWKNFLSSGNDWIEVDLDSHKTTLIIGDNGAGKSTLLDAVSYLLFGKAYRNINKPQLINSINNKGLLVEGEFSVGTSEYYIKRGLKPVVFEIYKNGDLIKQEDLVDYQDIIEKQILKANHKSFCQMVILGASTFQAFMQLPTGKRREIIEDILDLEIFTNMNVLLKDKMQKNGDLLNDKNTNKKITEEKIKMLKEHLSSMQSHNDFLIDEKKQRIKTAEDYIKQYNITKNILEKEILELSDEIKNEDACNKKLSKLLKIKHQLEAKLSVVENDIKFFAEHNNCPTCKQEIESSFKEKNILNKQEYSKELIDGIDDLSIQYDELNAQLQVFIEIKQKIIDKKMNLNLLENDISNSLTYINSLNKEIQYINKINDIDDLKKLSDLEEELGVLKNKISELVYDKDVMQLSALLLKDGGIKAKIVKQYIPIINNLINKYLASMDFMCQFELDESFKETIKSRYRDEFSYESFSEGEKMRINLAVLFTWRAISKLRNSISTNILIMDEIIDGSLDGCGIEDFMAIISSLTSDTNTFIISHQKDQLIDRFDRVLKFKKVKNFSTMESIS